jgi:hypothetical protein
MRRGANPQVLMISRRYALSGGSFRVGPASDRMRVEQLVHRGVAGDEGEAVR